MVHLLRENRSAQKREVLHWLSVACHRLEHCNLLYLYSKAAAQLYNIVLVKYEYNVYDNVPCFMVYTNTSLFKYIVIQFFYRHMYMYRFSIEKRYTEKT